MRTILSTLYVLLMVIVPWLHMPLHAHEQEAVVSAHDSCGHHHGQQEKKPESTDDCGLCSLAVLSAELPEVLAAPQVLFTFSEAPGFQSENFYPSFQKLHQARAPPSLTV